MHQRKAQDILTAPKRGVEAFLLVQPDAASPDRIAVSALDQIGIPGVQKLFPQILVSGELCKQAADGNELPLPGPDGTDIPLCVPGDLLLLLRVLDGENGLRRGFVPKDAAFRVHDSASENLMQEIIDIHTRCREKSELFNTGSMGLKKLHAMPDNVGRLCCISFVYPDRA